MNIFSFSPFGYEGALVACEVDLRRGIPAVDIVGLADGAVKESRERMRSAIRNCGFDFPMERVLISLSPADLKKEGAGFDLALALAVLDAQKREKSSAAADSEQILVLGELELSGQIRAVRGIHAAASTAYDFGIRRCIVPFSNGEEAREVPGMKVFAAKNLTDAFEALYEADMFSEKDARTETFENCGVEFPPVTEEFDFKDVVGQEKLLRALQIAAAGGHNLLVYGPPGCGKTLSMQKFGALLPLLTEEESQSVTRIHSIAGLLSPGKPHILQSPFRMPHQTASIEGMCGGGPYCRPGEISLAHNGVLFLDEAAEFKTSVLQMLRVPLESGKITLSRAGRSTVYPARFQLLMATNPCPCGNYGVPSKVCLCSVRSVEMYWKKMSGPLLDRVDLRVQAYENEEVSDYHHVSTVELRIPIARAVMIQRRRGIKNALMTPPEIEEFCELGENERAYLEKQSVKNDFSHRAVAACKKIARTIADMDGREKICFEDLQEAVSLRKNSGPLESFCPGT